MRELNEKYSANKSILIPVLFNPFPTLVTYLQLRSLLTSLATLVLMKCTILGLISILCDTSLVKTVNWFIHDNSFFFTNVFQLGPNASFLRKSKYPNSSTSQTFVKYVSCVNYFCWCLIHLQTNFATFRSMLKWKFVRNFWFPSMFFWVCPDNFCLASNIIVFC